MNEIVVADPLPLLSPSCLLDNRAPFLLGNSNHIPHISALNPTKYQRQLLRSSNIFFYDLLKKIRLVDNFLGDMQDISVVEERVLI